MNRAVLLRLLTAIGLALVLRCPVLDRRPLHNDEAVNAFKFGDLWTHGTYQYDPNEYHGPSLYYATLAVARLTSTPDFEHLTEVKLRLITVAFGIGLILLLPLVADGLGRKATIWAAFFTALSPAMVFYSRYYIHEMLLVFFAFLALAAGWRYWRSRKIGWALLAGAGLGLMHATKETFPILLVAAGLALAANPLWSRYVEAAGSTAPASPLNRRHLAAAVTVWLVVALILFSSFFTNASGLLDSVRTYLPWMHRAQGASPHIHPWSFYLHRLLFFQVAKGPVWTEALIFMLALVGAAAGFTRRGLADGNASFVRFLALYTGAVTVAYSLISYKTPWCLLNFWHGMILLAGIGVVAVLGSIQRRGLRVVAWASLLIGVGHLGLQAWRADLPYAADPRNPYVYAQTSRDVLELVRQVEELASVSPQGNGMVIKVMAPEGDFWPLPWYLRRFNHVVWSEGIPPDPFAPVMIVASKLQANLDEKKTHLMRHEFDLRPKVPLELYFELELWKQYLAKHPPPVD